MMSWELASPEVLETGVGCVTQKWPTTDQGMMSDLVELTLPNQAPDAKFNSNQQCIKGSRLYLQRHLQGQTGGTGSYLHSSAFAPVGGLEVTLAKFTSWFPILSISFSVMSKGPTLPLIPVNVPPT